MSDDDARTGSTLFNLLRDYDSEAAWAAFVARYGPLILAWCKKWNLRGDDADDLSQDILVKLFASLRKFAYEPARGSFRSWLKTVAHHAWQDFLDGRRRGTAAVGGSDARDVVNAVPAPGDMAQALAEAFDLELLEEAKARVRLEVSDRDWHVFTALALAGRTGKEVAAELGMSVAAAFVARSRVQEKLRAAVAALEHDPEPDAGPNRS